MILLLELLLIENLNREDAVFVDTPEKKRKLLSASSSKYQSRIKEEKKPEKKRRRRKRDCVVLSSEFRAHTYKSNASFQYGFRVFLITEVVWVCSPPTVATAKGSGKPGKVNGQSVSIEPRLCAWRGGKLKLSKECHDLRKTSRR